MQAAGSSPRWMIICGALRSSQEFKAILSRALEFRKQGLLQEIVLSTWHNEIDSIPGLRAKLLKYGVHIVEADDSKEVGPYNLWRQYRSFDMGLRICPENAYIIKARTDKCLIYLNCWKYFIEHEFDLENLSQHKDLTVLPGRVWVPYLSQSAPFYCKDIFFYGHYKAVNELLHFEYWSKCTGNDFLVAETKWFFYPFFRRFSIFRDVFETVSYEDFSTAVTCRLLGSESPPKVVTQLIGCYWRLLAENLLPFYDNGKRRPISVENLLTVELKNPYLINQRHDVGTFSFLVCSGPWLFRNLTTNDNSTELSRLICQSFNDVGLLSRWKFLSQSERAELLEFVAPNKSRDISNTKNLLAEDRIEIDEISSWNSFDWDADMDAAIVEQEHRLVTMILEEDSFSPRLECRLASYWYKTGNPIRAKFWFKKIIHHKLIFEYDDYVECLIRYIRCEWLNESQSQDFPQISRSFADLEKNLIKIIIDPAENDLYKNTISLYKSISEKSAELPEPIINVLKLYLLEYLENKPPDEAQSMIASCK